MYFFSCDSDVKNGRRGNDGNNDSGIHERMIAK
jgi:hypothetical protein